MQLHELVDKAYQSFLQQLPDNRIVLLHPQSRYRSMLIAKLLNSPDHQVFYYAMGPDDINLQSFLTSITHDLADQHPTFGRHINMLSQEVYENPVGHFDLVMDTFVKDLMEISDRDFLLVLDEYDRSDTADDVQRFVERLSAHLPAKGRIVVNGRTLPRLPWVSMIAQHRAVILRDDEVILDDFYDNKREGEGGMDIYALGPGFVRADGEPIDNWEGHLPRLLFFFALDRPVITRSEICQAFWPDLDPDQAVNVFHVTKRRLHKALENDVLIHDDGYYKINPEMPVYYDVMEFVSTLMKARQVQTIEEKMALWEKAAELYGGPFLQGHDEDWINQRREEFRAGYLEALTGMADFFVENDRAEQALQLYQTALEEDETREDIHRKTMKIFVELGRRSEAAGHYQRMVEMIKPSTETQLFYQELMT
ncbi:MAG: hypothetical protein OHK0046_27210 [Anaerolineae bacterium]